MARRLRRTRRSPHSAAPCSRSCAGGSDEQDPDDRRKAQREGPLIASVASTLSQSSTEREQLARVDQIECSKPAADFAVVQNTRVRLVVGYGDTRGRRACSCRLAAEGTQTCRRVDDARADRDSVGIARRLEAVDRWTVRPTYRFLRRSHVSIANGASAVRVVRTVHVGTSVPYTGAYHPRPDSSSPCASRSSPASCSEPRRVARRDASRAGARRVAPQRPGGIEVPVRPCGDLLLSPRISSTISHAAAGRRAPACGDAAAARSRRATPRPSRTRRCAASRGAARRRASRQ